MLGDVNRQFERLSSDIKRFESVRNIHDGREEQVVKALQWLRQRQRQQGYWGEQSLLDTQLTLISFGLWSKGIREWPLIGGGQGGIDLAFGWLDEFQIDSAWENNIWDTSAILQAAAAFDMLERPSIVKAKAWLEGRAVDKWGLDGGDGAHYISQAIIAMVACHSPEAVIHTAREALLAVAQREVVNGTITPYVEGQVIAALISSGVNPADETVAKISARLMTFLLTAEVTISNWLHLCSAFRGVSLAIGSAGLEHPTVQTSIQRLFSPNRIRNDGSWYRSVTMTSWALLALDSIQTVRKIDGYAYQIFLSVERTRKHVVDLTKKGRDARAFALVLGIALTILTEAVLAMFVVFFSGTRGFLYDPNLLFFLIPAALGVMGIILRRLWTLVRPDRSEATPT